MTPFSLEAIDHVVIRAIDHAGLVAFLSMRLAASSLGIALSLG